MRGDKREPQVVDLFQPLRSRIADGERVTVADVAKVAAVDAAATLQRLHAEVAADQAASARVLERQARVAALLQSFEVQADRIIDRMEAAGAQFDAALVELAAVSDDFDSVHRVHLEQLHDAGWNMRDGSSPVLATSNRVIMDRDHLGKITVVVPYGSSHVQGTSRLIDAALYARWGRERQAERDRANHTRPLEIV